MKNRGILLSVRALVAVNLYLTSFIFCAFLSSVASAGSLEIELISSGSYTDGGELVELGGDRECVQRHARLEEARDIESGTVVSLTAADKKLEINSVVAFTKDYQHVSLTAEENFRHVSFVGSGVFVLFSDRRGGQLAGSPGAVYFIDAKESHVDLERVTLLPDVPLAVMGIFRPDYPDSQLIFGRKYVILYAHASQKLDILGNVDHGMFVDVLVRLAVCGQVIRLTDGMYYREYLLKGFSAGSL